MGYRFFMQDKRHVFGEIRYEIVRTIAEGGMGMVAEAKQHGAGEFAKTVAMKFIREEYASIPEFRSNFIGEAKLVADLVHTNIVQTYHLGEMGGDFYMVMEYVNGVNLDQLLGRHRISGVQFPVQLAVFVISRVCRGLAYAHEKQDREGHLLGIVHRDVGPKNIMIAHEGDVKLTDFGIAKARNLMYNAEGEVIAGKDDYLSPEQARCEVTDGRADLFACGIVLAEMLLGYNPFSAGTPEETHANIIGMPLPDFRSRRSEIDANLADILRRSLERDRDKRYQTAREMMQALEYYLYKDGYGPTNEKLAEYLRDFMSRHPEPVPRGFKLTTDGRTAH
jgi:serine/threonine protein kinase